MLIKSSSFALLENTYTTKKIYTLLNILVMMKISRHPHSWLVFSRTELFTPLWLASFIVRKVAKIVNKFRRRRSIRPPTRIRSFVASYTHLAVNKDVELTSSQLQPLLIHVPSFFGNELSNGTPLSVYPCDCRAFSPFESSIFPSCHVISYQSVVG